jgi:hypothetical protein
MREFSVRRHTCKACPGLRPGIATLAECSSLPANRPYFLAPSAEPFARHCLWRSILRWETSQLSNPFPRAFGVQSIYQPYKTEASSEFAGFAGFFRVFLEIENEAKQREIYMLWLKEATRLLAVMAMQNAAGHFGADNRSTRDGTEVLGRWRKWLSLLALVSRLAGRGRPARLSVIAFLALDMRCKPGALIDYCTSLTFPLKKITFISL